MGWRDKNTRVNRWAGEHPVQYALVLSFALAVVQLAVKTLFDRPFFWTTFLIWIIVFPILAAAIARRRWTRDATTAD